MQVNVLYGRGNRSGGPEAVHQLVHELRALGVDAYVVPDRRTVGNARVAEYASYEAPERRVVPDEPSQVVVAPEVYLPELLALRRARLLCWWLSIDNSPVFRAERYLADVTAGLADRPRAREARSFVWLARRELGGWRHRLRGIGHLSQSSYATDYLRRRLDVDAHPLSDYIPGAATAVLPARVNTASTPAIAFNPAKGARLLRGVRRRVRDDVRWLPIEGLSPDGVRERLAEATAYLDLGPHPGKDRMPREAALAGAVSLVARRGSGAYEDDVAIPAEHKVALDGDVVGHALEVVGTVLDETDKAFARQQDYRTGIQAQEGVFRAEVAALVARLESTGAGS